MSIDVWRIGGVSQPRPVAGPTMPLSALEFSTTRDMAHNTNLSVYQEESTCPKWVVNRSNLSGRGLFASQPIKKGTLIFSNKPLVVGPREDHAGDTYCTVCYKICDCYLCRKCQLLVCSEECNKSQNHAKECDCIYENWIPKLNCENYYKALPVVLIYLRFLLLTEDLKSSLNIYQKSKIHTNAEQLQLLCSNYSIPEEQVEFMNVMNSLIRINSFRIASSPQKTKKVPLRGFYPISAFLNHSCVPNTRNVFRNDYEMAIYATKDIEIDEEILTCYTGLLWSTPARRYQLYKTKGFWCKCERCKDRTEMGTNLSALKCLDKDCVGILLPVSAVDVRTEWKCDNCGSKVSGERISAVQGVLGSLVGTLDLDDQLRLETHVLERLAKLIPYSSHIFVDLRLRLSLKLGFAEGLKLNGIKQESIIRYRIV